MAKNIIIKIGLVISFVLALYACCLSTGATAYLPDGTEAESVAEETQKTAIGTALLRSGDWHANIHFNDEGVVTEMSDSNICGYGVTVQMPRVSAALQEMLDGKHLKIIEVNLVRFTDMEPWNKLEPDVQSLYFVVNPWENHGEVQISWQTPEIDTNLAQGFRQTGPRCCFSLSVNNLTGYLYSPAFGGEGIARSHIGFSDGTLIVDSYLIDKLEKIVQAY